MVKKTKNKSLFNKSEEEIEKLRIGLNSIVGVSLKYKQLCDVLNLPLKGGDAKCKQLEDLLTLCDYKILNNPTRYKVIEVYEEVLPVMKDLCGKNRDNLQLFFEGCLYREFYNNDCQPVYLSTTQLLKMFTQVNDNFAFACDKDKMVKASRKTGKDYTYMTPIAQRIYVLLRDWSDRVVKRMVARCAIKVQYGFRLYKKEWIDGEEIYFTYDVPINSQEEKELMEVYEECVLEHMGYNWNGCWVDNRIWDMFQRALNKKIKDKYFGGGDWKELKRIKVYSPSTNDRVKKNLLEICHTLDENAITEETKDRILSKRHVGIDFVMKDGKEVDSGVTVFQKEEFVRVNVQKMDMSIINFRSLLFEKKVP